MDMYHAGCGLVLVIFMATMIGVVVILWTVQGLHKHTHFSYLTQVSKVP
jgi:hypothetical protein